MAGGEIGPVSCKVTFSGKNSVKISKQDATTGKELTGAKLELYNASGTKVDTWVSTTTPHIIENLAPGVYTLKETIAPKGYVLNTEVVTFTVKADGTVAGNVVMKNKPEEIEEGPKTGNVLSIISLIMSVFCIAFSIYYLISMKKANN